MPAQNQEIVVIILIATALALLLVGFIVTSLFLYQRRQHRQEAREIGEPIEELVLGAENHGRPQDRSFGESGQGRLLAAALAGDIGVGRIRVGADP